MRLKTFIVKEGISDKLQRINIEKIVKKCSQYFEEFGSATQNGYFFWRGTYSCPNKICKIIPRKNRKPTDTNIQVHEMVDDLFYEKFGWKPRSEGVFTSPDINIADGYGKTYIFLPANGYKYVYSTKTLHEDMYASIGSLYSDEYGTDSSSEDFEDEWSNMYEPASIPSSSSLGQWVSKEYPKLFKSFDKIDNEMYKMNYILHKEGWSKIVYKPEYKDKLWKNKNEIIWNWIIPKNSPTKKEYIKMREEEYDKKVRGKIYNKIKKYVDTCSDKNVISKLKTEKGTEVMFKCKYYYLIPERYSGIVSEVYNEYELR